MTKIALCLLTAAAFLYGAWLLLWRRRLPDPEAAGGWRRRFRAATVIFAALLAGTLFYGSSAHSGEGPEIMCYKVMRRPATSTPGRMAFADAIRAVWTRLSEKEAEAFKKTTDTYVRKGVIRQRVAAMLKNAFRRLAFHKRTTRGNPRVTCYKPSISGGVQMQSAEAALKQIELLRRMKARGAIDAATAQKAHTVLARELEALQRVREASAGDWRAARELVEAYRQGRIVAGDSATVAAGLVLAMEGAPARQALDPAARLRTMQARVRQVLSSPPPGADWRDPAINPNVLSLLEQVGLVSRTPQVMCYKRAALPVKERSLELKQLQQELLDRQVKAGVLALEVARKAGAASTREQAPDYATEQDLRAFQQKVRRVGRLLCKRGEAPPSFIEALERAVDVQIVRFDPAAARRAEITWHLRTMLRQPVGERITEILQQRKLVLPARNHRGRFKLFGRNHKLSAGQEKQLARFQALLQADQPIELAADQGKTLALSSIGAADREYILRVRRALRALLQSGLLRYDQQRLRPLARALSLPLIGRVQEKR